MAQLGSCWRMPSNVRRAIRNQYECSIAMPRSNSACTLGSQDVAKVTLPSLWSCCATAPPARAAVIIPMASKVRRDRVFIGKTPCLGQIVNIELVHSDDFTAWRWINWSSQPSGWFPGVLGSRQSNAGIRLLKAAQRPFGVISTLAERFRIPFAALGREEVSAVDVDGTGQTRNWVEH